MYRPQPHSVMALTLFLVIAGSYLVMAVRFPVAYIWATYEDLFGEWGQTYFFAIACLIAIRLALSRSPYRWFFALLALALFYTVMEEISWGQRILGFESPEFFKRYNLQRETNLHNMLVGPISTVTKDVIEFTVATALALYGVIYPLMLRLRRGPAAWLHRMGVAAPPLYLWPFFLAAAVLETGWLGFNEAEVAEILIGCALAIMGMHYLLAQRHQADAGEPPAPAQSRRLAGAIAAVSVTVALLAVSTTHAMYSDPEKRARIDARLLNGYEKFAKRYARYGRWDVTADFYLRIHQVEPLRTSILRRLARAWREMGDQERFLFYTRKALDIALAKHAKNPNKISTNLALARTYRQLGEADKAREHSLRAHEIALARAERKPGSAHWAYWLGKTYRDMGNYQAALEQYEKAFRLKPSSSKYRKAWHAMKRATGQ